jgi:hypothetical protein
LKLEYQAKRDNKNIDAKNEEEKIGKKLAKALYQIENLRLDAVIRHTENVLLHRP